jgi:hypothetical protein
MTHCDNHDKCFLHLKEGETCQQRTELKDGIWYCRKEAIALQIFTQDLTNGKTKIYANRETSGDRENS